jgi:hypothetical protein
MFRSLVDAKFMQKYGIERGFGLKRAMVFDRPPVLTRLFQDLGLPIPAAFRDGLGRASRIHKENTAAPSAALPKAVAATPPAPPGLPSTTPPGTPPGNIVAARNALDKGKNISDIIGGYGKPINPYGLSVRNQEELIKEFKENPGPAREAHLKRLAQKLASPQPGTPPNSPPYRPSTPLRGGTRSVRKSTKGTRKVKKTVEHLAKAFSKVWAKLGHKGKK